ncbi:lysozyme C, milk isozyme-like [Mustelus asterias]
MKTLIFLSILLTVSSAKLLSRCDVVRAVRNSVLTAFPKYSAADWACLAHHASQYNTLAQYDVKDNEGIVQSRDYGIFQINSKWWCADENFPNGPNACSTNCKVFLKDSKDIQADIDCAALIVNQQGMEAWHSWVENCQGKLVRFYTLFCEW